MLFLTNPINHGNSKSNNRDDIKMREVLKLQLLFITNDALLNTWESGGI